MAIVVTHTTDPAVALAGAGDFLQSRPVEHNVALTILEARLGPEPMPGRYWWAVDGSSVVGYAFQSPPDMYVGLTPMVRAATDALADAMASVAPDLPGIIGDVTTAAAFAGTWAGRLHTPANPEAAQRLYKLGTLTAPRDVPGSLRFATDTDRDTLVQWDEGFAADTGLRRPGSNAASVVDHNLQTGRVGIWDDDGPVSTALTRVPVAGVARVGLVYTPPSHRGRGYASACVAAISRHVLATDADTCVLYTQLSNPTSNAIYAALGYEPVAEVVTYHFG